MKRKTIMSALLITAIAGVSLLGCGNTASKPGTAASSAASEESGGTQAAASGEKIDLLLWMPPFGTGDSLDKEFWTKTLEPWAEEHHVNLSIEITPWGNYEEKYLTGFSSGEGPDVGYMYLEMFNDFIEMGTLADIDSYFTQEEKDNYLYYDQGHM